MYIAHSDSFVSFLLESGSFATGSNTCIFNNSINNFNNNSNYSNNFSTPPLSISNLHKGATFKQCHEKF